MNFTGMSRGGGDGQVVLKHGFDVRDAAPGGHGENLSTLQAASPAAARSSRRQPQSHQGVPQAQTSARSRSPVRPEQRQPERGGDKADDGAGDDRK